MTLRRALPLLVVLLAAGTGSAQGIRDRIRGGERSTAVNEAQAEALTLTLSPVALRSIQSWIRVAGAIDSTGRGLTATLSTEEAALVKAGQRVRAFPPSSKSSMYQARVVRVTPDGKGVRVDVALAAVGWPTTKGYVVEIVTDHGELLSVPNEAIIEEGDTRVVYRQASDGQYEPTPVQTGVQGELYTQVTGGLKDGDQVVTFGSFFIDSEFKLKGAAQGQK